MDSQEATSNAIKSPSDRGESVVKTNTTLSPDIRTGTQGPIGSPRQPVNNGSVTKLRPGRPPVQIRFDSHSPGGLSGPTGQFVQQRPYGPIKPPPGGSFPRKPLQQSPNSPIVLNPCFAPSPVQRAGLQIGPRPPHPGNYQAQQFQGNVHRPQQPRLEYQNTRQQLRPELLQNTHQQPRLEFPNTRQQQPRPELRDIHQQAYNLESFARSPEIAQRQLKRNESWLNIPQQSLPSKREDKKSALPRPVVDKMANVDDSKKHQQIENTSSKEEIELSKNVENDDDDDVVMDGKKSPRTNDGVTCQKELTETKSSKQESTETVKRPETATINGKIDKPAAPKEAANEKVSDISADLNNKKSVEDSNVKECNDRLSSAKSQGKVEETSLDKVETLEESAKKLVDAVHQDYENEKLNKENARRLSTQAEVNSSTTSATKEDKTVTSDSKNASTEQSDKQSEKSDVEENEHKLNVSPTSPEKVHDTVPPTEQNGDNSQEPQTLFKYPDKSHVNTPAEQLKENQTEKEPETVSKPAEKLQGSAPTNATKDEKQEEPQTSPKKDEKEQEPKTSPKSLANSQIDENSSKSSESSPPKFDQNEDKQESKAPLKSPDKLPVSTPAEVNQNEKDSKVVTKSLNASEEKKAAETEKKENEDELNVEAEAVNALEASAPVEINETREKKKQSRDEHESKSEVKLSEDSSKKMAESENEEELNASSEKSEKSHTSTLAGVNENQKELESNESSKLTESSEKFKEKIPTDLKLSSQEEVSKDLSTSSTDKSTNLAKEAGEENIVENSHPDKHAQNVPESNVVSSANDSAACEGNKTEKSPEEGVKGFDNGEQRSLVSPSQSPQSSVSPQLTKSSTDVEKLTDNEKKETVTVEKDDGKKTPESERLETCKTAVERVPTPAKMDERSEKKFSIPEIENGGVMNESAQSNAQPTTNGVADSPTKKSPSKSKDVDKRSTAESPIKSPSKSVKSLPRTPDTPSSTGGQEKKKLPMNKIQVGAAPSPNLKTVRSKIGSLDNASYKPGGGKVKIENRKLDFSKAQPKIAAKNEKYTPSGGDKKIAQVKLQWNAKPKVGSLDNATYKPGGGDKKIETVKLDFKDKAKPKVGSKDNAKHVPGGGSIKSSTTPPKTPQDTNNDIQTQKIDIKAESKIGSLDNVKHKPGGGDKKIFNDKDYLRQTGSNVESLNGSGSQSPVPPGTVDAGNNGLPTSDENLNQEC